MLQILIAMQIYRYINALSSYFTYKSVVGEGIFFLFWFGEIVQLFVANSYPIATISMQNVTYLWSTCLTYIVQKLKEIIEHKQLNTSIHALLFKLFTDDTLNQINIFI